MGDHLPVGRCQSAAAFSAMTSSSYRYWRISADEYRPMSGGRIPKCSDRRGQRS
jgi:hypothetical protein